MQHVYDIDKIIMQIFQSQDEAANFIELMIEEV